MEDNINPGGPEVTEVRIYPYEVDRGKHRIVAYADILFDGILWLRGIQLIKTEQEGFFISLPSKRLRGELFEFVKVEKPEYLRYLRRKIRTGYKEYTGE